MLHRTEAIVLRTAPFSEADLIVTFLTRDSGILKAFAKSPRKVKSRFGSSLEPLTLSTISFWGKEDANLPRLTQADIIQSFQPVRERLDLFLPALEVVELALNLLPEREPNRSAFFLLRDIFIVLEGHGTAVPPLREHGSPIETLVTFSKIRLLDLTGYGPSLSGCARCSRAGRDFYISHGSVICSACASESDGPIRLSQGAIRLYSALRQWEASRINRIRPSRPLLKEIEGLLTAHLEYTLAKPLRVRGLKA